jgi:hypothetical protein
MVINNKTVRETLWLRVFFYFNYATPQNITPSWDYYCFHDSSLLLCVQHWRKFVGDACPLPVHSRCCCEASGTACCVRPGKGTVVRRGDVSVAQSGSLGVCNTPV